LAAAFLLAFCYLLILSCGENGKNVLFNKNYKSFTYNLQGTWKSNETSEYSGTLEINGNTIKISGYAANSQYEWLNGTDNRPFKDFTKNLQLEGYSEEGKIFIKDAGVIQEGIPYTYWESTPQEPDFIKVPFLRFRFGGRDETLRKQ
jgi:hypothetical protein